MWPSLKVKLTTSATTVVKLGINDKKKYENGVTEFVKQISSLSPQRTWGDVAVQSLTTTVRLKRRRHSRGRRGLSRIRDCLWLPEDGCGYEHTWNFYGSRCLCVDSFL